MKINKNITIEPSFKSIKGQYIYSSMKGSEAALVFELNTAGFKRL
jgi:hypothetical protein